MSSDDLEKGAGLARGGTKTSTNALGGELPSFAMAAPQHSSSIDATNARFPYCIVWTPLPIIAWLVPFVGHLGICEADGIIYDFAGPYFVSRDNFTFGKTARYVRLSPDRICAGGGRLSWDEAIRDSVREYQNHMYNLFTCNCHSFVATCLNRMAYRGHANWNLIDLVVLVVFKGRWVNTWGVVKTFLPFLIIMGVGLYFGRWMFAIAWGGFTLVLLGWFVFGTYLCRGLIRT